MNSNIKNKIHKTVEFYFNCFIELFFPKICVVCGRRLSRHENWVCIVCWFDLPVAYFNNRTENKVAQLFSEHINIKHAASYFSYQKDSQYKQIIYAIKYYGIKELGFETGRKFGDTLKEITNLKTVDLLVPVPLHPRKQKNRGYNQSEWIARGISDAMNLPVITNNLVRKVHTSTQTKKNRSERWQNVQEIFDVKNPDFFKGKHILLIDDVVTTGATLTSCAENLLKIEGVNVSIATLAFSTR